jgi:hypothetical protein
MLRLWGVIMPIYRLLQNKAFQPEAVAVMGEVFEDAIRTLGLVDRADPLTELVAKKVIELAQEGVSDRVRLRTLTLKAFDIMAP